MKKIFTTICLAVVFALTLSASAQTNTSGTSSDTSSDDTPAASSQPAGDGSLPQVPDGQPAPSSPTEDLGIQR